MRGEYSLFTAVRFFNEKHNCHSFNLSLHFFAETVVCYLRGEDCAVSTVCL